MEPKMWILALLLLSLLFDGIDVGAAELNHKTERISGVFGC